MVDPNAPPEPPQLSDEQYRILTRSVGLARTGDKLAGVLLADEPGERAPRLLLEVLLLGEPLLLLLLVVLSSTSISSSSSDSGSVIESPSS